MLINILAIICSSLYIYKMFPELISHYTALEIRGTSVSASFITTIALLLEAIVTYHSGLYIIAFSCVVMFVFKVCITYLRIKKQNSRYGVIRRLFWG